MTSKKRQELGKMEIYIPCMAIICAFSSALSTDRRVAQACNRTGGYRALRSIFIARRKFRKL